ARCRLLLIAPPRTPVHTRSLHDALPISDLQRRSGLYGTAVADSVLERSVLVAEPDLIERRAVDRIDRLLFQPRRVVLGQAFGGVDPGLCADPDLRLDQPETAGARPVVRGRQMSSSNLNSTYFKNKNKDGGHHG